MSDPYPAEPARRNRWIESLRPVDAQAARRSLDARTPYAFLSEVEPDGGGRLVTVSTIFLTNRECPWKCVMCDLWRNTLSEQVPVDAIPAQIDYALARLPTASHVKLYNAGSFFDPGAIPPDDDAAIADRLRTFDRVIVESHPALVGGRCVEFRRRLGGELEVAIGLETAHPQALERINKGMTLPQFAAAAAVLRDQGMGLRVFLLVGAPFIPAAEQDEWLERSIKFAFDQGASVVSLIPTRGGNGAMEMLAARGDFTPPALADLERAMHHALGLSRGRVFVDLWDLARFSSCPQCFEARRARLEAMNLGQSILPGVWCSACGGGAAL